MTAHHDTATDWTQAVYGLLSLLDICEQTRYLGIKEQYRDGARTSEVLITFQRQDIMKCGSDSRGCKFVNREHLHAEKQSICL